VHPYKDEDRVVQHLERAHELGCVAVGINLDGMYGCKAWDEQPGPDYLGPQTVEQVRRFAGITPLPFVIKGMLSPQDAIAARELGASGVIVSIYGGEAIDYARPVLRALPDIRAVVPGMTVLADSGFQRGTDVLKALSLGADGVSIVSLLLIAVAARGRDGVRIFMELLQEELQRAMSFVGIETPDTAEPSVLHRVPRA
jgi:isopentenyl diphosphate isomerase/L-lactate dehydrogenase-like FMN-dependent dehydrogenase